jgi:redox-sensitive bicupin YhaK (pirin superfamily)
VRFQATEPAQFLVLSGAEIREPVLAQGPFVVNKPAQVEAALARYQAGQMGHLAPLAESGAQPDQ